MSSTPLYARVRQGVQQGAPLKRSPVRLSVRLFNSFLFVPSFGPSSGPSFVRQVADGPPPREPPPAPPVGQRAAGSDGPRRASVGRGERALAPLPDRTPVLLANYLELDFDTRF